MKQRGKPKPFAESDEKGLSSTFVKMEEVCLSKSSSRSLSRTADFPDLLTNKNRPFGVIARVDELHGEYPKGAVQKPLDALAYEVKIICKLFGKTTKLYSLKQEDLPIARPEQLIHTDKLHL
jgi:hypothetical protein